MGVIGLVGCSRAKKDLEATGEGCQALSSTCGNDEFSDCFSVVDCGGCYNLDVGEGYAQSACSGCLGICGNACVVCSFVVPNLDLAVSPEELPDGE